MNPFMQRLRAHPRQPLGGTFLMSASALVAEAVGVSGFEFGIVDMEHGPLDLMGTVHMLQAIAGTAMLPVVRVPWNDTVTVKRVLDAGAPTLLFPFVQSADEAKAAVAATRYPPEGVRGMAGVSRGSRFGTVADHFTQSNRRIGVIVQLETTEAVQRLEEIAQVPGVDALFLGPADLSASMGVPGQLTHPELIELIADAARRCQAAGKPVGTLVGSPDTLNLFPGISFDFVVVGSDMAFLVRYGQAQAQALRARLGQAATGAHSAAY